MKIRKKRKKDINNKKNLKKPMIILTMLICVIIAMISYWIYAYHHKYGKFYFEEIKLISYKLDDYVETKGNIVYLKNLDESIVNDFTNKQQNIINRNNIINIEVTKELYKNILSIMINYNIEETGSNHEKVLTLNIDLKKEKVLSNDEMLEKANTSYKNIATNIFDEFIKLPDDSNKTVTDTITEEKLKASEFNKNSEKYIIRIREKLPEIINIYIKDEKVYYSVELSEINKLCYYTNNKLVNIKREIGKI